MTGNCKQPVWTYPAWSAYAALLPLGFVSCSSVPPRAEISVRSLEQASSSNPIHAQRAIVEDTPAIDSICVPLGPRLGLVQIRHSAEWTQLQKAIPEVGPCPDLVHGCVVGVISRAGLPLNGEWPINLDDVRINQGAGYVSATFQGGSYLPDGTTYLEWAYVEGLNSVLIVDVNGLRYFTD